MPIYEYTATHSDQRCPHCEGSFDVLAEVVCENDEDLIELLNKRVRGIPGVQSTETFVYLKLQKQFYNWGTR